MTNNAKQKGRNLPAEWDNRVKRVLLAFPTSETDWDYMLEEAKDCFARIIKAIVEEAGLEVLLIADSEEVNPYLAKYAIPLHSVKVVDIPINDTWARDFGPITIENDESQNIEYLDFKFNGWGLKFAADKDNQICRNLNNQSGVFGGRPLIDCQDFVLEGGSIESDGEGTVLTTRECLLSPNRNAHFNRQQIEDILKERLGCRRVLWLEHGALAGDDTDSHIDTLARFLDPHTIAYVKCYDDKDEHKTELDMMERELQDLRDFCGEAYKLVPLPLPQPVYDSQGYRLPDTYANFLITPQAILVPIYGQPENDRIAIECLKAHSGGRKVVGVDCKALIQQHGSLHCVTMQMI